MPPIRIGGLFGQTPMENHETPLNPQTLISPGSPNSVANGNPSNHTNNNNNNKNNSTNNTSSNSGGNENSGSILNKTSSENPWLLPQSHPLHPHLSTHLSFARLPQQLQQQQLSSSNTLRYLATGCASPNNVAMLMAGPNSNPELMGTINNSSNFTESVERDSFSVFQHQHQQQLKQQPQNPQHNRLEIY